MALVGLLGCILLLLAREVDAGSVASSNGSRLMCCPKKWKLTYGLGPACRPCTETERRSSANETALFPEVGQPGDQPIDDAVASATEGDRVASWAALSGVAVVAAGAVYALRRTRRPPMHEPFLE